MKLMIVFILLSMFSIFICAQNSPSILWENTYDGGSSERASVVIQTSDNGFIIGGSSQTSDSFNVLKTDENGIVIWSEYYDMYYITDIFQLTDNGFILAGDDRIIKVDSNGQIEWTQIYSAIIGIDIWSVKQTSDGGFILGGSYACDEFGSTDFWLLKTDDFGNEEWSNQYGENDESHEIAKFVHQTDDNGYILIGQREFPVQIIALKINNQGEEEWVQFYEEYMDDMSCAIDADDGFIIVGGISEWPGSIISMIKIDDFGTVEWQRIHGDSEIHEGINSIAKTSDGGYVMTGRTDNENDHDNKDLLVVKTDTDGEEVWRASYDIYNSESGKSIQQTSDLGYIIAGNVYFPPYDVWLVRLDSGTFTSDNLLNVNNTIIRNFPNPFNPSTTFEFFIKKDSEVELTIYNIKGQKINVLTNSEFPRGEHSIVWNGDTELGEPVTSGVYSLQFKVDGKTEAIDKCLLLK